MVAETPVGQACSLSRGHPSPVPPPLTLQYAVAQLPDAKGMFPENHPHFMGTYWGAVSWPAVAEVVESADLVLTVGCVDGLLHGRLLTAAQA